MEYLFYQKQLGGPLEPEARRPELHVEWWRPTCGRPLPPGLPVVPFAFWSLFHFLGLFTTREYSLVLIRQGDRLVHRTCLFPPHYKFPFMRPSDLQVAGIWTDPAFRGGGLGLVGLREVLRRYAHSDRTLWYLVRAENAASIRLAEKAELRLVGRGLRNTRLGLRALGSFELTEAIQG